jgi:phospholipid-binding lipoprotein MlaA
MRMHSTNLMSRIVIAPAIILLGFTLAFHEQDAAYAATAETGETVAAVPESAAPAGEPHKTFDILLPVNWVFYQVNDPLQRFVFVPIGIGYNYVIPRPARHGINNLLNNVLTPFSAINNLLQGKVKNCGTEFARFGINTTVGLVGLFEVAEPWAGLEAHPEDLGQTLGKWHIPAGPYLCMPLIGPSTLRDLPFTFTMSHKAPEWHHGEKLEPIRFAKGVSLFTINGLSLTYGNYGESRKAAKSEGVSHYSFLRDKYVDMRYRKAKDLDED